MRVIVSIVILCLLSTGALTAGSMATSAWAVGNGNGSPWPHIVSRLAETYGVNGDLARRVFDDLVSKPHSHLYLLKDEKMPCDVYLRCEDVPDHFLLKLIDAAMKHQVVEEQRWRSWWATMAGVASALISLIALVLSIVAVYRSKGRTHE